jgi:glycosyltransferase involved in cell wall biosynthesis
VHVVHHGVDPADFPFSADAGDFVAFIGRFAPVKGPHLAIDAACAAGVPIRLAGRPHEGEGEDYHAREMLPRLARPSVTWIGEVGGAEKYELFAHARATLFPVAWEEPFMIESMLAGTPVIAFPLGAAPEVIDQGVTGFLVDDVEGMAAAIRESATLDRARCRARAAERFHVTRMVRDYLRVYRAAIADHRAAPAVRRTGPRIEVGGRA